MIQTRQSKMLQKRRVSEEEDTTVKKAKVNSQSCVENTVKFVQLNDDCLQHVFSFLTMEERVRTERVCHQWLRVSQREWCKQTVLCTNNYSRFNERAQLGIFRRVLTSSGENLKLIEIESCSSSFLAFLMKLNPVCQNLVALRLCDVHCQTGLRIHRKFPRLEFLNLNVISNMLDSELTTTVCNLPFLKDLTINSNLKYSFLRYLPASIRNLELHLLYKESVKFLIEGLSNPEVKLEQLTLLKWSLCWRFDSEDLCQILTLVAPTLKSLALLGDFIFWTKMNGCLPQLNTLSVDLGLCGRNLKHFFQSCPNLVTLIVQAPKLYTLHPSEPLYEYLSVLTNLVTLDLSDRFICDHALDNLSRYAPKTLKCLVLNLKSRSQDPLTCSSLFGCVTALPNLERLEVTKHLSSRTDNVVKCVFRAVRQRTNNTPLTLIFYGQEGKNEKWEFSDANFFILWLNAGRENYAVN